MNLPFPYKRWGRSLAPWILLAIAFQVGIRWVWPMQVEQALASLDRQRVLKTVVPRPEVLTARRDSLLRDSIELGRALVRARDRAVPANDPAAALAAELVPEFGAAGWSLQRVKAQAKDGVAVLDLGADANFQSVLDMLGRLRRNRFAIQIRRLSIRPISSGKLGVDLVVSAPIRSQP